jgi:Cof subfamily protein (haloacid dehalogenase superfamily)
MNTKYVFLDVDGTLVNFKGEVPQSAILAMKKAQANGHKMLLATGRQKSQIYKFLTDAIDFDGVLASSAAYVEYEGKVIFQSRPTKEKLCQLVDFFHENNIPFFLQSKDMLYAEKESYETIYNHMKAAGNGEALLESIFGNTTIVDDPKELDCIEKVAYYQSPFDINATQRLLGDYFYVISYSFSLDQRLFHGEITFDGINKAGGIKLLMDAIGVNLEDCIAVGDSGNDLEMIKAAGYGVAMGNASPDVKAAADLVTTHIDDDGIYHAFLKMGLI